VPFCLGQLLGHAEGHAGREDGDLGDRVGVLAQRGHQGVPGLPGDGAGEQGWVRASAARAAARVWPGPSDAGWENASA